MIKEVIMSRLIRPVAWLKPLFGIFILLAAATHGADGATSRLPVRWEFDAGAEGWSATHRASVSEITRRPGGGSLVIEPDTTTQE